MGQAVKQGGKTAKAADVTALALVVQS